ncbi:MAG TPA: integrase, partial [Desulfobacterales bacterium]|nr:integrase [Desulfobacterales bacterium]
MGALKRHPTQYKGVFYREVERIGFKGLERMYYIVFKKDGKLYEEKVGGQYRDNMTPARANRVRAAKIEGYEATKQAIKAEQAKTVWTIDRLWDEYIGPKPETKSFQTDRYRYQKYLQSPLGKKEPVDLSQIELHRLKITLAKNLSAKTVKNILELFERIVNFGAKKGLCQGLRFKIEMPRLNNLKTEFLTDEQLSDLLAAIDTDPDIQAGTLLRLALCTGMRRGELLKLQWADVDFEQGFITIREPKGGKDQVIPLNQAAR